MTAAVLPRCSATSFMTVLIARFVGLGCAANAWAARTVASSCGGVSYGHLVVDQHEMRVPARR